MASISNARLVLMLFVAIVAIIAGILLGWLLGIGLVLIGLALVLPMAYKWKFAFLIIGIILVLFALITRVV